jgi:hypothetical protein
MEAAVAEFVLGTGEPPNTVAVMFALGVTATVVPAAIGFSRTGFASDTKNESVPPLAVRP